MILAVTTKATPPVISKATTTAVTSTPFGARKADQRATLIGLGLNRPGRVSTLEDTPSVRGMINKVSYLVKVL